MTSSERKAGKQERMRKMIENLRPYTEQWEPEPEPVVDKQYVHTTPSERRAGKRNRIKAMLKVLLPQQHSMVDEK